MADTGDTRPTFEQAFESAEAPPASDPSASASTPDTPASATTSPDAQTTTPETAPPGEPPQERWPDILKNAREKTRAEVEAQYADLQWAKGAKREDVERGIELIRSLQTNALPTWTELTQAMLNHPELGAMTRTELARVMASFRGQATAEPEEPQPDLVADNGTPVYSAPQLKKWNEWNRTRQEAELQQRLQPYEALRAESEQARVMTAASEWATQALSQARSWHGFAEHEAAIKQELVAHEDWTLEQAYNAVLQRDILPKLTGATRDAVVQDLKTKAAAASLNPGQAAPVTPRRPKDFWEALGVER